MVELVTESGLAVDLGGCAAASSFFALIAYRTSIEDNSFLKWFTIDLTI